MNSQPPVHIREKKEEHIEAINALNNTDEKTRCYAISSYENVLKKFKNVFNVDSKSKGRPCLSRLKNKNTKCKRPRPCEPCEIPHRDHSSLWLDNGDPVLYTCHLYDLPGAIVMDIIDYCSNHGFYPSFHSDLSYYFPGRTTLVAVETPERRASRLGTDPEKYYIED